MILDNEQIHVVLHWAARTCYLEVKYKVWNMPVRFSAHIYISRMKFWKIIFNHPKFGSMYAPLCFTLKAILLMLCFKMNHTSVIGIIKFCPYYNNMTNLLNVKISDPMCSVNATQRFRPVPFFKFWTHNILNNYFASNGLSFIYGCLSMIEVLIHLFCLYDLLFIAFVIQNW